MASSSSSLPNRPVSNQYPQPPSGPRAQRRPSWPQPPPPPPQQPPPPPSYERATLKPRERYLGRNGFTEITLPPSSAAARERLAAQTKRDALFVLNEMGEYFPPLSKLKDHARTSALTATATLPSTSTSLETPTPIPESIATLKSRIAQLKEEHQRNIDKIFAYFKSQVDEENLEQYVLADVPKELELDDPRVQRIWVDYFKNVDQTFRQSTFDLYTSHHSFLEHYKHDHLKHTLLPLYTRLASLTHLEETRRREREAMFPDSADEFRRMDRIASVAAQRRVALFLVVDQKRREEMMDQSRWAWRQVQPLINTYQASKALREDVQQILNASQTRDPRVRR